jgi:hypothetical protein
LLPALGFRTYARDRAFAALDSSILEDSTVVLERPMAKPPGFRPVYFSGTVRFGLDNVADLFVSSDEDGAKHQTLDDCFNDWGLELNSQDHLTLL